MNKEYGITALIDNLKNSPPDIRYYVEPADGGGVVFIGDSLEEAAGWVENQNATWHEV